MSPTQHTVVSTVVSFGFWSLTQSWAASILCFLGGIFIDLDHLLDYWIAKRKIFFTYPELLKFFEQESQGKMYLIFHSYEFLCVLWILEIAFLPSPEFLAVLAGTTIHLFLDQFFNEMRPFSYFFSYRIKCHFRKEEIFAPGYYEK